MVAMNQACDYVRGLWFKIIIMGITVEETKYVYDDNQYVLDNTIMPEWTTKKKFNTTGLHFVREGRAIYEWRMVYINMHINVSDIMTNTL